MSSSLLLVPDPELTRTVGGLSFDFGVFLQF